VPLDGCHVTDVYGLVNIGVWLLEESWPSRHRLRLLGLPQISIADLNFYQKAEHDF